MKNTLTDLNNHLFAQMERLSEESTKGDDLKEEIERSRAISSIAKDITSNATVVLNAQKFVFDTTGQAPDRNTFLVKQQQAPAISQA